LSVVFGYNPILKNLVDQLTNRPVAQNFLHGDLDDIGDIAIIANFAKSFFLTSS